MLSGCAGMFPGGGGGVVSTAVSASDQLLGMIMNKVFPTELRPVEPNYPEFFRDLSTELQYNCPRGDCRSAKFGWMKDNANFVAECVPVKNGLMGCRHFKQAHGDMKVYPAGASVFRLDNFRFEMIAYELRGDGKTDKVSVALQQEHYPHHLDTRPQEGVKLTNLAADRLPRNEPVPLVTIERKDYLPVAPKSPPVVIVPQSIQPVAKGSRLAVVPQKKLASQQPTKTVESPGKIIRADFHTTPIVKKKEIINKPKKTKKNKGVPKKVPPVRRDLRIA